MAFLRMTEQELARRWNEMFSCMLEATHARFVEKHERKAQVALLKGAAIVAAADAALEHRSDLSAPPAPPEATDER